MHIHKYFAEFLGTFLLALAVGLSLSFDIALPTPLLAGFTLLYCVYTMGSISGAHINPAVTLSLLTLDKITFTDAIWYIVSQMLGGLAALGVSTAIGGTHAVTVVDSFPVFALEALGASILVFGICSVVYSKVHAAASGILIGGSLTLGALLASTVSNGVLNPAVAIAVPSLSFSYIFGPIVGAICGAWAYRGLIKH